ncbi:hypothetical protein E2L08_04415 [Palleronia sediminis]|uniref:Nucleotide-diphospho-sugar transferase domain-containing protein n=1 Tax=Palleronia sediminis TaxID=2547833 RepID=A0A4R6AFM2_9RHOB|nr:putative nucleotide-diphospho-sugar transferase [Palleronia sediminis]TDL81902.1 hypothetical protein E2L08_04415 [Palleronia sediminis]
MTTDPTAPRDGFVFAATGDAYRALARRTARNLRAVMPGAQIDLFTDAALFDPIFDRVHPLSHKGTRPKMEALRESRFARTVYLDCDVVAVAEVSDVFTVLDRADIAGAHEMYGSSPVAMMTHGDPVPAAFRQINSGVLAIRKSDATRAFLDRWETELETSGLRRDQPVLRSLLWNGDLRLAVLPMEYNMMHTGLLPAMSKRMSAPRLLHITTLHEIAAGSPETPIELAEVLDERTLRALYARLGGDRTLGAAPTIRDRLGETLRRYPTAEKQVRRWWRRFR